MFALPNAAPPAAVCGDAAAPLAATPIRGAGDEPAGAASGEQPGAALQTGRKRVPRELGNLTPFAWDAKDATVGPAMMRDFAAGVRAALQRAASGAAVMSGLCTKNAPAICVALCSR